MIPTIAQQVECAKPRPEPEPKPKRVATVRARIILALSALEEARLPDLFAFFKAQGSVMTSSSMRATLFDMKHLGWVKIEKRKGENWYSLHPDPQLQAEER